MLSTATYEAFGALTSATLGNGQTIEQSYSADGRLLARRLRQGSTTLLHGLAYAYDNDDNPISITDEVDASRSVAFAYDAADRLTRVDLASGAMRREDYLHDANGNRTAVQRRALPGDVAPASTDSYTRQAGTNRIASIATASGTRTLSHDARGNLSGESRPGSIAVSASYDGYGRLTGYTRTGEPALAMTYNGMDQRVTLTRGTTTTRFVHDPDGRIIGEYTSGPTAPLAEYIWLLPEIEDAGEAGGDDGASGWHPLAVSTANGSGGAPTLLWLHSNHLGTPVRASSSTGAPLILFTRLCGPSPGAGARGPGFPGRHKGGRFHTCFAVTFRLVRSTPLILRPCKARLTHEEKCWGWLAEREGFEPSMGF